MNDTHIAYAAGSIDADGCLTIKRSTTRMRGNNGCSRATYIPRIYLGQVTEQVPLFLKQLFGGSIYITKPGTRNSRPMFKWMISDKSAAAAAKTLLPFLKIKQQQAHEIIALQEIRMQKGNRQLATWYAKEHPNWKNEELITTSECVKLLGYRSNESISQAIRLGTILCAHPGRHGRNEIPKIPKGLIMELIPLKGKGSMFVSAPQFVKAQHEIYERVRLLNTIGINGTCVNHRTGYHAQLA